MKIRPFFEALNTRIPAAALIRDEDRDIFSFRPGALSESLNDNILYTGLPKLFLEKDFNPRANLILTAGPNDPDSVSLGQKNPEANILFVSGITQTQLFGFISDIFMEENRFMNRLNQLSALSSSGANLQKLIDLAQSFLQCPIVVIDTSYRVIAISLGELQHDEHSLSRQQEIGSITERNLSRMKRDRIFEKIRSTPARMLYSKAPDSDSWWVNMIITVHGIEVAEAGIQETGRKFGHYDFQFFRFLQQIISIELQKSRYFDRSFGISHAIFVRELLERHFLSAEIIEERARLLGWKKYPYYFVMTVFSSNQAKNTSQKRFDIFVYRIQSILSGCRWRVSEENLVILIPRSSASFLYFRKLDALWDLLRINHFRAVLSNPFSELQKAYLGYGQCLEIARLFGVLGEEPLLFYADQTVLCMGNLLRESRDLRAFCHPCILEIAEYDREHGTSFLPTLQEYLTNLHNTALCAENLHIHKNTLYYRINKLCDLFDLDLRDGGLRMRLQMSLELLRLGEPDWHGVD